MANDVPPSTTAFRWGVKASFVRYIEGLPDGRIALSEGASWADSAFVFPLRDRFESEYRFDGAVDFNGHYGMLGVSLADIRVALTGDAAVLSIAARDVEGGRVEFARGTVTARSLASATFSLALTIDGVDLFGGTYRAGEGLDDGEIRLH